MARILITSASLGMFLCGFAAGDDPVDFVLTEPAPLRESAAVEVDATPVRVKVNAEAETAKPSKPAAEYAEILKALGEATAALNKAMQSAPQNGVRARFEEIRQIEATRVQVEAALKKLEARRDALRKAVAAQATAVRTRTTASGIYGGVRVNVDRDDTIERFAVLMPGGPLIVEVDLKRDGKPFRHEREKLLDDMLAAADRNDDGKIEWLEAWKTPRFTMGRFRLQNDQQRDVYTRQFDTNSNGIVDRGEARMVMARYFQGDAFVVVQGSAFGGNLRVYSNGRVMQQSNGSANVSRLLDTNNDNALDSDEVAAAAERLKSRDADDNDLLYVAEINGAAPPQGVRQQIVSAAGLSRGGQAQAAVLLGPASSPANVIRLLRLQYGTDSGPIGKDAFYADESLFEKLDSDSDGVLEVGEVTALNDIEPHVRLQANIGKSKGQWLTVVEAAEGLERSDETDRSASIQRGRVRVTFSSPAETQQRRVQFGATAQAYLSRFDGDNNGYLEKDEVQAGLVQQFELWDANNDGKVFKDEIEAALKLMQAPQRSQVRASVVKEGSPLFKAMDRSGDNRLSLREMKTAQERLKEFDQNSDGLITNDEIPVAMTVTFGAGTSGYRYAVPGAVQQQTRPTVDAPDWFQRMDRNGDGDVTLKEFPGTKADFEKLDTNKDGFVEPAEAKAAAE